jgi:hypothetical protein
MRPTIYHISKLSAGKPVFGFCHLRLTDKTRVDPEFGAKVISKLMGNLRITVLCERINRVN